MEERGSENACWGGFGRRGTLVCCWVWLSELEACTVDLELFVENDEFAASEDIGLGLGWPSADESSRPDMGSADTGATER